MAGTQLVSIKYTPKTGEHDGRIFVVSKKVSKKATVRNLLKRRARAIVRLNRAAIRPGYDIVFIFSKKTAKIEYAMLQEAMLASLAASRLLV